MDENGRKIIVAENYSEKKYDKITWRDIQKIEEKVVPKHREKYWGVIGLYIGLLFVSSFLFIPAIKYDDFSGLIYCFGVTVVLMIIVVGIKRGLDLGWAWLCEGYIKEALNDKITEDINGLVIERHKVKNINLDNNIVIVRKGNKFLVVEKNKKNIMKINYAVAIDDIAQFEEMIKGKFKYIEMDEKKEIENVANDN